MSMNQKPKKIHQSSPGIYENSASSTLPLTPPNSLPLWHQSTKKASYGSCCRGTARKRSRSSSSSSDREPSMTDGSCGSELTGGVAFVEALVLALPGRGSVEVVIGSAEEVSASEVVTAEAAGCVNCGGRVSSPAPPPESGACGTMGRATD